MKTPLATCSHEKFTVKRNGRVITYVCVKCGFVHQSKKHKFGVGPIASRTVDGRVFHSELEANTYIQLCHEEALGLVSGLICQYEFRMDLYCKRPDKPRQIIRRKWNYICDFIYCREGCAIAHEAKGEWTTEGRRKFKTAAKLYPEFKFIATGKEWLRK